MVFSKKLQSELEAKLLKMFTEAVIEAKEKQDWTILNEPMWLERVFNAHLIEGDKQLFLLGVLALKVHDLAPRAMKDTMKVMGMWKEDSSDS